jgi:hypothetical protein
MLIKDINYLETFNENIEGGIAVASATAGTSTAAGNNFSNTADTSIANTSQNLFDLFGSGFIAARFTANSTATSFSQSS